MGYILGTEFFGFTGIVFNGIPRLMENFSITKLKFNTVVAGFNESLGTREIIR